MRKDGDGMSFATEQKDDIIATIKKNACCRRSLLLGVLSTRATVSCDTVNVPISGGEVIDFLASYILEFYGRLPEVLSPKKGGRNKDVTFVSKSAAKYVSNSMNNIDFKPKCALCQSAFLQGMFLACGRVSDPSKQHSLELSVEPSMADSVVEYLSTLGLSFSKAERGAEVCIYTKRSETIEDFFALAGMNNTVFKLMNAKINSEVRNNANRVSNCETNNISKAVDAAARQVALIRELESRGLLGALPEELLETARLRIKYEDMSLSQLAMAMSTPISKSGLSHRLKKLTELAESLVLKSEIL